MKFRKTQKKIERTPQELARLNQIREKYQKARPTEEELASNEDYSPAVPLQIYLETKDFMRGS